MEKRLNGETSQILELLAADIEDKLDITLRKPKGQRGRSSEYTSVGRMLFVKYAKILYEGVNPKLVSDYSLSKMLGYPPDNSVVTYLKTQTDSKIIALDKARIVDIWIRSKYVKYLEVKMDILKQQEKELSDKMKEVDNLLNNITKYD